MLAMTSVGSVRTMLSTTRNTATTPRLLLMLVEASTAKGSASVLPSTEPITDILIVSNRGLHTLSR